AGAGGGRALDTTPFVFFWRGVVPNPGRVGWGSAGGEGARRAPPPPPPPPRPPCPSRFRPPAWFCRSRLRRARFHRAPLRWALSVVWSAAPGGWGSAIGGGAVVGFATAHLALEGEVAVAGERGLGARHHPTADGGVVGEEVDDHRGEGLGVGEVGERGVDDLVVGAVRRAPGSAHVRMDDRHHL